MAVNNAIGHMMPPKAVNNFFAICRLPDLPARRRFLVRALFFAVLWLPINSSLAQTTNSYMGPSGGYWSAATNWSLGTVPTLSNDVLINANTAVNVVASSSAGRVRLSGAGARINILTDVPLNATAIEMTDASGNQVPIYMDAGTINLNSGVGSITTTGATSLLHINGNATLNLASANLTYLWLKSGGGAPSQLTITNGQTYNATITYLASAAGQSTLNLNGGTLHAGTMILNVLAGNITNTFNLNSGTLTADTIRRDFDGLSMNFNFNNGTIANRSGVDMTISRGAGATQNMVISLAATGSHAFQVEADRKITVAATALLADKSGEQGTLLKTGPGQLVLAGTNTYTGLTTVQNGSLVVSNVVRCATINPNSVSVVFATNPAVGNYPLLAGPLATNSFANRGVSVAGGEPVTNAILTNRPNLIVTVGSAPVIISATNVAGAVGSPFNYQIVASGSPAVYGASGLPAGLSLDPQTGLVAGTPSTVAFTGNFTITASNALGMASQSVAYTLAHISEGVWGDFASAPETPTALGVIFNGQTVLGSVGGSDAVDYLTFSVPSGYRLQSMRMRFYPTVDATGTIAVASGATWAAGENASAMLGSGSLRAADVGSDLLAAMQVPGSALNAGTYTLRVRRTGAVAAYGFEFKLVAVGAPSGEITASPSTVFLLPGQVGTSIISWTTSGFSNAEVYVFTDGNPGGQLFGRAPSAAGGPANWITQGRIVFRLYGGTARTELLDEVVVTGAPSPLRLAGVFGNDMVLQRNASVPVWGWAEPGQPVQVLFAGQTQSTTAGPDGRWLVRLDPMAASTTGRDMQVTSGGASLTLANVLVGEVWVLSGQSNMAMSLADTGDTNAVARASYPWLRTFTVGWPFGTQSHPNLDPYRAGPALDVTAAGSQWSVISPANAGNVYAVGFYFAEGLRQALGSGVPIGLIQGAVGSTSGECWVGKAARDADPALQYIGTEVWSASPTTPWFVDKYVMYHAMIAPLQPYGIRGVLWYQGEGNTYQGEPNGGPHVSHYRDLLTGLIEGWRRDWNQGEFPFFLVQLPKYGASKVPWDSWERVREAQLQVSQEVPNSGLAISIDTGSADPHPVDKQPIGERLARLARAKVHGEAIVPTGPIYDGGSADAAGVNLRFVNAGSGLQSSGGDLRTFEVAGADGLFSPAAATITGIDTVRLTSLSVPRIVFVRYGWDWSPDCNLVNSDLLPASPFRAQMSGTLGASPSKITLAPGTTGSTVLSWSTTISPGVRLTQAVNGGAETVLGVSGASGNTTVSGLGIGRIVFRLYGDPERTQLLDSVEVVGTTAPLTVQSDGSLWLDNRPFTGIGVNYYSAFNRVLWNPDDTTYDEGFRTLAAWGLPFARMDLSGYSPVYTGLFFTNRAEYFRRLDGVVASAERHGIGLIPSFFWTTFAISDLAGEHLDQLAVTQSATREKMREFATEIVNRYKNSRVIWAWEFGNEWNLMVDLPNGEQFLPPTWTDLGNPATRDPVRDQLSTDIILPAMLDIGRLIKELDPGRPLSTGHAMSRPSQWHQDRWNKGLLPINSVYTTDSEAQAEEITVRQCPDPYDLLSVHVYGSEPQRLPNFATFAARAGKALFAGEFGTPPGADGNFAFMLAAVRAHSPLSAVWVFDRREDEYNITTTNAQSWMLRDLLPATFTAWSRGWSADELPGPDGTTAGAQYILGFPRPGVAGQRTAAGLSTNALWLEAVVRTNDPSWRIFGQASVTLSPGSWGTNDVVSISSTNQSDVLPGCERRIFSVPAATATKFLRVRAQQSP